MSDPRFTATDTGFRDAVGRSRRRRHRRRTAAASAAGTTVAAAVAVLALGGTPLAPDSLRQNQPAAPPDLPQASPTGPSAAAGVSPGAGPPAVVGEPAPVATDVTAPAVGPQAGGDPGQARSTPEPSGSPTRQPTISSPVTVSAADYRSNQPCADMTGRAATGWCVQPGDDFDGASGQPTELAVSLCRLPGFPTAAARFPSTAEAALALYDERGQRRLWDHASQHPGTPSEHTRTVEPGRCLVWTTTWTNRDDSGAALPPGAYELRLAVRADNIDGANEAITQNYRYTVHEH